MAEPAAAGRSGELPEALAEALQRFSSLVAGTPFMGIPQARRIWSHFAACGVVDALDIGTCYGASAAYMAGAMQALGVDGHVTTVDSALFDDANDARDRCVELWDRCGVRDRIEMVRIPHSGYAWHLMDLVRTGTDGDGRCTPQYDFVYLDGAKWLPLDGASFAFLPPLIRDGGWLLFDDLDWSFDGHPHFAPVIQLPTGDAYRLSADELRVPHVRALWDHAVVHHPSFSEFVEQADGWGWAHKTAGDERRVWVETRRKPLHLGLKARRLGIALGLRPLYRRLTDRNDPRQAVAVRQTPSRTAASATYSATSGPTRVSNTDGMT